MLCIGRIIYPVTSLGRGKRLVIWLKGCNLKCEGCMSKDLWEFDEEDYMPIFDIFNIVYDYRQKIDGITISGGEPFLQIDPLLQLLEKIYNYITKDIIIFTGYYKTELEKNFICQFNMLKKYVSVIIAGRYIENRNNSEGLAGSSNQEYLLFDNKYKIEELEKYKREINIFNFKNSVVLVGILNSKGDDR